MFFQDDYGKLRSFKTPKCQLLYSIEEKPIARQLESKRINNTLCDEIAMACALDKNVITQKTTAYAFVELNGKHTRGQVVIDWHRHLGKEENVIIIEEIQTSLYQKLLIEAVQ